MTVREWLREHLGAAIIIGFILTAVVGWCWVIRDSRKEISQPHKPLTELPKSAPIKAPVQTDKLGEHTALPSVLFGKQLSELVEDIAALEESGYQSAEEMERLKRRFAALEIKLTEEIRQSLQEVATKTEVWDLDRRASNLEGEVERVEDRVDRTADKIDEITKQGAEGRQDINTLKGLAADTNKRFKVAEKRLTLVETQVVDLNRRVDVVDWRYALKVQEQCWHRKPKVSRGREPDLFAEMQITRKTAEEVCAQYEQRTK